MATANFTKTESVGVVYRESTARKTSAGKPDRCYYYRISSDGRGEFRKVGWESEGYTVKKAVQVRSARIQALRHGIGIKPKAIPTLSQVWEQYLQAESVNLKTTRPYEAHWRNHLEKAFGSRALDKITALDIEKFKKERLAMGLATTTVNQQLAILTMLFRLAIKWGAFPGPSPLAGVKKLKDTTARLRFLTHEEAEAVLEHFKESDQLMHDIVLASLRTGMRLNEIMSMRVGQVRLNENVITLDRKGGSGHVYITADLKVALTRLTSDKGPYEPVFAEKTRRVTDVARRFKAAVDKFGLNDGVNDPRYKVVFHTLRHTFASWLAIQGESLYVIKDLMGHASIQVTQRYAHLCPSTGRDAVARLSERWTFGRGLPAGADPVPTIDV